jgi:pyruvate dehydrogenase E1 component beta subunit
LAVITYREAISQALREELERDESVFLLGEEIGAYGGSYAVTKGFLEKFGERRVKDTPISESVIVGAAIGAAMGGLRPVAEIMTINFSLLAMDQIVNNAAKIKYMSGGQVSVPMVVRTVSGGGFRLGAQHSQSLEGWFAHVPGLKVANPATPFDAKGLLKSAIRDDNPVMFIEHSLLYGTKGEVPEGDYTIPFGVADIKRQGTDATIVAYSRMVHLALGAAIILAQKGIEVEVVDLRTLRPLDTETVVNSVEKTNRAIVVEESCKTGGFGGEVISRIQEEAFDHLDGPVEWVAGAEAPMPYAKGLERAAVPTELGVVEVVERLVRGKG